MEVLGFVLITSPSDFPTASGVSLLWSHVPSPTHPLTAISNNFLNKPFSTKRISSPIWHSGTIGSIIEANDVGGIKGPEAWDAMIS